MIFRDWPPAFAPILNKFSRNVINGQRRTAVVSGLIRPYFAHALPSGDRRQAKYASKILSELTLGTGPG